MVVNDKWKNRHTDRRDEVKAEDRREKDLVEITPFQVQND
jgi:hypothetical protein